MIPTERARVSGADEVLALAHEERLLGPRGRMHTVSSRRNNMDFGGFDSRRFSISRGGNPRSIGGVPKT